MQGLWVQTGLEINNFVLVYVILKYYCNLPNETRFIFMAIELLHASIAMTISTAERDFFVSMGGRIAALRKARNITQVQLAEKLGISQQTLQSYECGRRRVPVSAMPVVAQHLTVSLDELFDAPSQGAAKSAPAKRGPLPQWQQQLQRIATLPRAKQQVVMQMLDGVLAAEATA
jgi:transcriptional regulator with XRE-family HTH domain